MDYDILQVGSFEVNCAILWGEEKIAWIIDAGGDPDEIRAFLADRGLTPGALLFTHGHFDHVGALDALTAAWPAIPAYMGEADAAWAFTMPFNQMHPYYRLQQRPATLKTVNEGDLISLGGLTARVIALPGHTPGGVGYLFNENLLFSGDTLFAGDVGRSDLPGGNWPTLHASLQRLLTALPEATTVWPGHGPATTIGAEKRGNPHAGFQNV